MHCEQQSSTHHHPLDTDWGYRIAVALLLLLLLARCLHAAWILSPTYDEGLHLLDGYNWLLDGKVQDERNPPLGKAWLAAPLLVLRPDRPSEVNPLSRQETIFDNAADFLRPVNDDQAKKFAGRCSAVVLLLLLCAGAAWWTKQLAGRGASLAVLFLLTTEPNLIAHGMLTTLDIAAALGVLLTLWSWWRLVQQPSNKRAIVCGLALAFAAGSKLSCLALLPLLLILLLFWIRHGNSSLSTDEPWRPAQAVKAFFLVCLTTGVALWAVYGFAIGPIYVPNDPYGFSARSEYYARAIPFSFLVPKKTAYWMVSHLPMPAPAFWRGIATVLAQVDEGQRTFLFGDVSLKGWPYFYLVVAVLKLTTPCWLLLFLTAGWSRIEWRNRYDAFIPIAGLVWLFCVASFSHFQLGIRHILPLIPLLFIVISIGTVHLLRKGKLIRRLTILCLAFAPVPGALIHPGYLSFINLFSGGPDHGYLYLTDSNYDWGQDFHQALGYIETHPDETIRMDVFGNFEYEALGLDRYRLTHSVDVYPEPGTYLIGATCLQGFGMRGSPGPHPWLLLQEPDERLGWSIFVYRISQSREPTGFDF